MAEAISTSTTAGRSAATCPVYALAREAKALIDAYTANDERMPETAGRGRMRLEEINDRLLARVDTIETRASQLQATSLEGALYQVMVARTEAEVLAGFAAHGDGEGYEARHARLGGLLCSVARLIERTAGVDREALFGDWHGGREADPLADLPAAEARAA